MASLSLQGIRKRYGALDTIHGVDLDIDSGEFVVFVGPSGCGKSTLLRMVAGLEEISDGRLTIGGRDVTHLPPPQRGVAMVFQSYALYPHMTVYQNMAFGLSLAGTERAELHRRVTQAAEILQLGPLLERLPKALSGGQRQRVAIGRAIVRRPQVFLFDEPLSNLDAALRVQMRIELARLHAEMQATMVYVTHDQVEAMTLADRIVVINQGRIEQVGTPLSLYHHPRNLFVAGFIGSPRMNFLPARAGHEPGRFVLANGGIEVAGIALPGLAPAAAVTLGIRPEHIELADDTSGAVPGRVEVIEHLGNETFAHLDIGDDAQALLVARLDAESAVVRGQRLWLRLPSQRLQVFADDGRNLRPEVGA
ncbi:sn-glycerol-3-phosphate ABC transporter ATP-binding protein UgpC [Ideonella sp. 4Y16]|uniref:ABC transporter ATP-binding protein n=1 Tax=Ideonella alba TaxID=2824118 RepID=UPI001B371EAE|nr:sn-glycerol-3-phosphate ABC transporter ATP-binding protein UgpC [Ideonella alba]MBQ0943643.1 sn-glycerol-3-phosphate ABC transporter ATP-binding protein UgpC [Ideonella alba]